MSEYLQRKVNRTFMLMHLRLITMFVFQTCYSILKSTVLQNYSVEVPGILIDTVYIKLRINKYVVKRQF